MVRGTVKGDPGGEQRLHARMSVRIPSLPKPPSPRLFICVHTKTQRTNQKIHRPFVQVRREVSEPHEAVRLRTQQLKNLHAATRLLKRALRFLSALRRLRSQEGALGLNSAALAAGTGSGGGGGGGGAAGKGGGVADLRELAKAAQSLQVCWGWGLGALTPFVWMWFYVFQV